MIRSDFDSVFLFEISNLKSNIHNPFRMPIFTSERTGRAFVDLKRRWQDTRTRAKLVDFHFHDLRHTAATRLADAGADAFTIAEILGHSSLAMVKRYTHATDENKRKALEKIGVFQERVANMYQPEVLPDRQDTQTVVNKVEQRRVELLTSALRTRRSAKLSYCPTGEAR